MKRSSLVIGTRGSELALWQSEFVAGALRRFYPGVAVSLKRIETRGDRERETPLPGIGGKGLFTAELEAALAAGAIDLAVHSYKDLPVEVTPAFTIGAVPVRARVYDVLVARGGFDLAGLPAGARVGTSSLRRVAQLRAVRPDLDVVPVRGNVPTRLAKVLRTESDVGYHAVVVAEAGLERLGLLRASYQRLPFAVMLPAPAQGALAVQCRADDRDVLEMLRPLDDEESRVSVEAERTFLGALEAGCRLPVAAFARRDGDELVMDGRVLDPTGQSIVQVSGRLPYAGIPHAIELGNRLAEEALAGGAHALLEMALLL